MKNIEGPEIFAFLCIFNPMMSVYSSPIPGMDFGTFCVLIFILYMFKDRQRKSYKLPVYFSIILVYTILSTCIGLTGMLYSDFFSILLRLLRFVVVLIVMLGIGFPTYFDKELFVKYLGSATVLVAGYAIFQTLAYYIFGIEVSGIFGPTKLTLDEDLVPESAIDLLYRPPSLFWEPSHASYFMTPYLCYLLFYKGDFKNKKDLLLVLVVSLGILVTTSGQGLAVLSICWAYWFLISLKKLNFGLITFAIILLIVILKHFEVYDTIERVIDSSSNFNAVDARSGGYDMIKALPVTSLIFGFGYGNYDETVYYSSFADIIFCTGYIGLIFVGWMYFRLFINGVRFQKMLVLMSLLLMSGGGIYTASYLCLFLPILFYRKWEPKVRNIR